MIPKKVINYLDSRGVKYEKVPHKQVFTTFDLANTLKEKMSKIAKTLLVKADKKYVLVVLPAHYRLDMAKLKKVLKAKAIELAPEKAMEKILKVKPGALTPFACLHKVEPYLDKALLKAEKAIFGAGSFTESLRMKVKDLYKLEKMTVAEISQAAKTKVKKVLAKKKKK
ncbi:MAG: YbaK/EbsC family protein [Patescibacteria group bacterium]